MDALKEFVFSLCVTMVIGAVLHYLLPEGSLQQLLKVVFCVFFLSSVCFPFLKTDFGDPSFSFETEKSKKAEESMTEELDLMTERQVEEEIKRSSEEILAKNEIDFREIRIKVNIEEDRSISITEFSVTVKGEEDSETAKSILSKEMGIEPEMKILEETDDGNA